MVISGTDGSHWAALADWFRGSKQTADADHAYEGVKENCHAEVWCTYLPVG